MWEGQRKFVGSNDLPMTEMSEIVPGRNTGSPFMLFKKQVLEKLLILVLYLHYKVPTVNKQISQGNHSNKEALISTTVYRKTCRYQDMSQKKIKEVKYQKCSTLN